MTTERLRVLIVGNGGREHALAWKLSQSPRVDTVFVAPGNGGTGSGASDKIQNANVKGDDYPGLVAFAQQNGVNLVVPGPEAPLVDGIQGYFQAGEYSQQTQIQATEVSAALLTTVTNSRYPMLWSLQGRCPHGGLQDLLEGFHEAPQHSHCRLRELL